MSRSEKFPTHYRIGVLNGKDVYLHPQVGLAVEREGRLADAELRDVRMQAHAVFDAYWKRGNRTRQEAYAWLADKLGIEITKCHIGGFDLETCHRVAEICKEEATP